MQMFEKNSTAALIVDMALEIEKYKKLYEKEKTDNKCLKRLMQTKRVFEARA
ncbi:hypothetical protein [Sulfurimonas sp.]